MRLLSAGYACNNACVFCAQGDLRLLEPERTPDVASVRDGDVVAFVGGEPTLRDELPAWVAEADALGASRILVQTNGRRLADRGFTTALARASRRLLLEVSLQGGTAPVHEWHTGVSGSFAETVRGLAAARSAAIPFVLTSVVTRSSFRNVGELVRLGHRMGAKGLHLALASAVGRALRDRDRVVPAPELALPYVSAALAEARRLGLPATLSPPGVAAAGLELAGLGDVEEASSAGEGEQKRRVTLEMYGRPAKAHAEVRVRSAQSGAKKSGEHLRELFPGLFADEEGGS